MSFFYKIFAAHYIISAARIFADLLRGFSLISSRDASTGFLVIIAIAPSFAND
jgi:hypothetical protein